MELKSKYITEEEFKQYTGIDLSLELKDDDNPSNKVQSFLCRVEIRIATFIDSNFHRNVELEYPKFSDYQKYHYKLALLEQCLYVFKNGDISVDSGYDSEKGVMISSGEKKKIVISENCKEHLILCGLWCRKIKPRARGSMDGWWLY